MILGQIRIKDYLERTKAEVKGRLVTDAKDRWYSTEYTWKDFDSEHIIVQRKDGHGDEVKVKAVVDLDESFIAFFGLYSGDGAKGSEVEGIPGKIKPSISFSQKEPNLVRFAVDQFRKLFSNAVRFTFSLGEDSAFFMAGEGHKLLNRYYKGTIPPTPKLSVIRPQLTPKDVQYLKENRPVPGTNEDYLAFYYEHKPAMELILSDVKRRDVEYAGIALHTGDRITASLRRPFKKGARQLGGTSRSDEIHVGGLNGFGELFLKILHEIEDSIYLDLNVSTSGLIQWIDTPSKIGETIDVKEFFTNHNYGSLFGTRPSFVDDGLLLKGRWRSSKELELHRTIKIDPLWCYVSGLYLAEGSSPKELLFSMFSKKPEALSLAFTSSENNSLELTLRSLQKLFQKDDCLEAWKIKVGSQYFPELVVIGLKEGVPMLRGGASGDGKLRTMEISLALKEWALGVAPCLNQYANKYSHVEPTGAGLARIDFWASSSLCKWYFPLLMYAVFGKEINDPERGFYNV